MARQNTVEDDDYVVINRSFVDRATSTVKSQKHLPILRPDQNGILESRPLIAEGLRFNLDFKHFGKRAPKPPVSTLEEAASEEVVSLGELLFILIGEIHDTTVLEETLVTRISIRCIGIQMQLIPLKLLTGLSR